MEKPSTESIKNELSSEELGLKFNLMDFHDYTQYLRQTVKENPSVRFTIVADWAGVNKARAAKALFDQYKTRLHIDSIIIKATRQQKDEDVNAFQSGVKWQEI